MHKVQCHSWDSDGKPISLDTFLGELIKEEAKHSSDANFHYTFNITTRVTQTAKECIVKAEPFMEMIPDDIDFIKMDISEQIILDQTFALPSKSLLDPTKTQCPLCGEEKSTMNLRRHMQRVHRIEIDPDFNASIGDSLKTGISQFNNEEEPIFEDIDISDPLIPENVRSLQDDIPTNVEYDEDTTSDCQSFELFSQKCKTKINRNSKKYRAKEKFDNCPVCGKEMVVRSVARHLRAIHTVHILPDIRPTVKVYAFPEGFQDTSSIDSQSFESFH